MMQSRAQFLKQRLLDAPFQVCPERAVLWTESMQQSEGKPQVIRNALAFQHLLDHMTVAIRPGELIVGSRTSKLRGAPLFPEVKAFAVETQIDTYDRRPIQPFEVDPADKRAIKNACLYWRGRTAWERAFGLMPRDLQRDVFALTFAVEAEFANGIGHFIAGNRKLLARGLAGIKEDAEAALASADFDEDRRRHFLEAVAITSDAAMGLARRYAAQARELAAKESDAARRAELIEIGEVCEHCLERPPRTFREAIQAVWFNQMLTQLECGGFAISIGRLDQLLDPYYRADLEAGRISAESACELIECLYVKMSEIVNVLDTVLLPVTSGPPIAQAITVGGVDRDGKDSATDLSRLFIRAFDQIRTVSPNLAVRLHEAAPADFTRQVMDAVRRSAPLALFNDEIVIKAMERKGVPLDQARDYAIVGCVEPTTQGDAFGSTDSNLVNLARCLELALGDGDGFDWLADLSSLSRRLGRYFMPNNGGPKRPLQLMLIRYLFATNKRLKLRASDLYRMIRGKQIGLPTGDPRRFSSLEELIHAFELQVAHAVTRMTQAMHFIGVAHAELKPTPFISSGIDDCVAQGLDVTWGGARYNYTGPQAVGLADVADSLAAVKKLVFDTCKVSMDELAAALRRDFADAEPLRQKLINHAPKYGNGDPEADGLARRVAAIYCREVSRHKNYRGGTFQPGLYSLSSHLFFGVLTNALPDGRKRGDPLANGVSPASGREKEGPAAVLRSAARIDGTSVTNGWVLNLSFDPESVKTETNLDKFIALNVGYFRQGGFQVQHNCISAGDLEEARCRPDRHRGLVVRVAGYSALFTELDAMTQDEIIRRVSHRI